MKSNTLKWTIYKVYVAEIKITSVYLQQWISIMKRFYRLFEHLFVVFKCINVFNPYTEIQQMLDIVLRLVTTEESYLQFFRSFLPIANIRKLLPLHKCSSIQFLLQPLLAIKPETLHIVRVENPVVIPSGSKGLNCMIPNQFFGTLLYRLLVSSHSILWKLFFAVIESKQVNTFLHSSISI